MLESRRYRRDRSELPATLRWWGSVAQGHLACHGCRRPSRRGRGAAGSRLVLPAALRRGVPRPPARTGQRTMAGSLHERGPLEGHVMFTAQYGHRRQFPAAAGQPEAGSYGHRRAARRGHLGWS